VTLTGSPRPTDPRRDRLAYAVALRQGGGIARPALTVRIIALTVVLTVLVEGVSLATLVLCLPAVAVCLLRARAAAQRGGRAVQSSPAVGPAAGSAEDRPPPDVRDPARSDPAPSARRRGWIALSWADLLSALLVMAVAVWGTTSTPQSERFLALSAASLLLAVVGARWSIDARWYRPDPNPRRIARLVRNLAGPLGAVACLVLALPAPWQPGERVVVAIIALLPLVNLALVRDQDLTIRCVAEMIRSEAQDGRQVVVDELHGTLSANLRLIEQSSQDLRTSSPRLYELCVSATSRLREALTLADPLTDDARRPESLEALVRALTMAVGARGDLTIGVDRLAEPDRDLVRLVLSDVVRVMLASNAGRISADIQRHGTWLRVQVNGDRFVHPSPLSELDPLRHRLSTLGGTVDLLGSAGDDPDRLVAQWPASADTR
jgi:hypothetical protein